MSALPANPSPLGKVGLGTTLFGYSVLGYLARGAGSTLYYAKRSGDPAVYALKVVQIKTERDERFYRQLRNEYLVSREVSHPGIRKTIEMYADKGLLKGVTQAAVLMQYCDGYTLDERVPAGTIERMCVLLRSAKAIAALNDAGFVHCDLKPSNIVVRSEARATVIDLGQACPVGTAKERVQGSVDYMAPEQATAQPITPRTDVYGFGATAYKALCGTALPTILSVGKKHADKLPRMTRAPHEVNPKVTRELSSLVMDCVRPDPAERPRDMHEVVSRLKTIGDQIIASRSNPQAQGS